MRYLTRVLTGPENRRRKSERRELGRLGMVKYTYACKVTMPFRSWNIARAKGEGYLPNT